MEGRTVVGMKNEKKKLLNKNLKKIFTESVLYSKEKKNFPFY